MPKPYVPTNKKTLYGTQPRPAPHDPYSFRKECEEFHRKKKEAEQEWQPQPRYCAICNEAKPNEWYELMEEGWVCDPCRPKATHIKRESQPEIPRSES